MRIPVLIAGGGPVGLSLATRLGQFGIHAMVVERHHDTSTLPKGRALSVRSMEIYRAWGLADEIAQAGVPRDQLAYYTGATLTARDYERTVADPAAGLAVPSPTFSVFCSQDRLEPLLRAHAKDLQPDLIRFGVEVVDCDINEAETVVRLRDHVLGRDETVRADYLIAADGAHSTIRTHLGITMTGYGEVSHNLNVLFEADLSAHVRDRLSMVYTVTRPGLRGTFHAVDDRRWLFNLANDGAGQVPAAIDEGACAALIRTATGVPGLDVTVLDRQVWRANARVADEFTAGRVLLVGDAAHVTTPYGGFSLNCGIADVDNLAWKLAAVQGGWAGPGLLRTYHDERRPVAVASAVESHRRLVEAIDAIDAGTEPRCRPADGLTLGYRYRSASVIEDETIAPAVDPVTTYEPTARPGHRAPHLWLDQGGRPVSTLDILGPGMTLLSGPRAASWVPSWQRAAAIAKIPMTAYFVGVGDLPDPDENFLDLYGISADGAVLVRPDGHVACRTPGPPRSDPGRLLAAIVGKNVSR